MVSLKEHAILKGFTYTVFEAQFSLYFKLKYNHDQLSGQVQLITLS